MIRAITVLVLVTTVAAAQVTIYVDAAAPGPGSGSALDPFPTIQAGLNAANNGDTVSVAPGTYVGVGNRDLDPQGKAISIVGPGGAAVTVIDCQAFSGNPYRGFHIYSGPGPVAITGFTIRNGYAPDGGAMHVSSPVTVTVADCVFSTNTASQMGGAVYCQDPSASPSFTNCGFNLNLAASGGAMAYWSCAGAVDQCVFDGNTAVAEGGALYNINWGDPTVTGSTFIGNVAGTHGGAVANLSISSPTFDGCTFENNSATGDGGAFFSQNQSDPTVTNGTFNINTAGGMGGAVFHSPGLVRGTFTGCTFTANGASSGAGITIWGTTPTITGCDFVSNVATADGGGIYNLNGGDSQVTSCFFFNNSAVNGAGAATWGLSNPTFTACIFDFNHASGQGGGAFALNQCNPIYDGCTFNDNGALWGGGLFQQGGTAPTTVTDCAFLANGATDGGGITAWGATVLVDRCRFDGNTAVSDGGGFLGIYAASLTVTNSLFSSNAASFGGGLAANTSATAAVVNCTLSGNSAAVQGGALFAANQGTLTLANGIVRQNTAPTFPQISGAPTDVTISYSNVEGGIPGPGNIDLPALFVSAPGDYHLAAGSPCIDAADNGALPPGILLDLDSSVRFFDVPGVPDTGVGPPPIVDMGAYEATGGIGQANSPFARLEINGLGIGTAQGPFSVNLPSPGTVTFSWSGPPGGTLLLLSGPLNPAGAVFPCVGSIDIGTPPFYSDLYLLFDGTQPPFDVFFTLDPTGSATQSFSLAAFPPGPLFDIQGVVYQPTAIPCLIVLTAAFSVSIL